MPKRLCHAATIVSNTAKCAYANLSTSGSCLVPRVERRNLACHCPVCQQHALPKALIQIMGKLRHCCLDYLTLGVPVVPLVSGMEDQTESGRASVAGSCPTSRRPAHAHMMVQMSSGDGEAEVLDKGKVGVSPHWWSDTGTPAAGSTCSPLSALGLPGGARCACPAWAKSSKEWAGIPSSATSCSASINATGRHSR